MTDETEVLGENFASDPSSTEKSHMTLTEIKPETPRWKAGD
jgi:hypothetical protein